ncbi:MAG: potassium channel family protein [Terrimicrobiaceae bacterium]|nr:potassium channel family protein [Terrimicrobiaceae bacterium]
MLSILLVACILVAITVTMHVAGITALLVALRMRHALSLERLWPLIRVLLVMTWCLVLLHLAEIAVWAVFYWWSGCLPDSETAFYFSGTTYTTIGYGDVVLTKPWRVLAPVEGLTGILMCGLSTGFFLAVLGRINQARHAHTAGGSTTE